MFIPTVHALGVSLLHCVAHVGGMFIAALLAPGRHVAVLCTMAEIEAIHALRNIAMRRPVPLPLDHRVVDGSDGFQVLDGDGSTLKMDQVELIPVFS